MKFGHSIVGGACAALLSQAAFAWIPGATTPDLTLLISGATASENGIKSLLVNTLCASDTDTFEGTNQKVVFCTMNSTTVPNLSGSLKVLIRKSGVGGSGNGVGPVCNGTPLTNGFMVVTTGTGGACTETAPGSRQYTCSGFTTETLTPQMGISDVAPNETFGGTASTGCGSNVYASFETIFGVPVTRKLRDAFQEAQGLTVGAEDAANMPSMSSQTYASLLSGKFAKWSDLHIPVGANGNLSNVSGAPADLRVTHCRRTDTAGTFAANQLRIMQRTCVAGAQSIANSNAFPADSGGPVITAQLSGSGDVENCLAAMNDTGAYNGRAGSAWAFGMLSTDRNPITQNKNYRFMKLNGVAPTFENVANGTYKHSVTSTIQWLSLTGDSLVIAQEIQKGSATPVELGNVRFIHPWGDSGLLAVAENGFAVTYTGTGTPLDPFKYDNTKPVTPFTHKTTVLSNCLDGLRVPGKLVPIP